MCVSYLKSENVCTFLKSRECICSRKNEKHRGVFSQSVSLF